MGSVKSCIFRLARATIDLLLGRSSPNIGSEFASLCAIYATHHARLCNGCFEGQEHIAIMHVNIDNRSFNLHFTFSCSPRLKAGIYRNTKTLTYLETFIDESILTHSAYMHSCEAILVKQAGVWVAQM